MGSDVEAKWSLLRVEGWRKLLAADAEPDRLLKSCPKTLAAAFSAAKYSLCVRKVRKVGKVLSVMTRTPFLAFLTFLTRGPQKKAAG
jgi:hypothetical protein